MGIYTAYDQQNRSPEKLEELYQFGRSLAPDVPAAPAPMPVPDFLTAFAGGEPVRQGSVAMAASGWYSQEALRITTELNNTYHTPEEIAVSITAEMILERARLREEKCGQQKQKCPMH